MLNRLRALGIEADKRPDGTLLVSTGCEDARVDALVHWSLRNEGIAAQAGPPGTVELTDDSTPESVERAFRMALCPDLLCFDVDGTLVNNTLAQLATIRRTLLELAGRRMPVDEIMAIRRSKHWIGDETFVIELCRRYGTEVSMAEVEHLMNLRYIGSDEQPGFCQFEQLIVHPEVLERLASRFSVALVTSRSRAKLTPLLPRLALPEDTPTVCHDDVTQDKPDPEGVNRARSLAGRQYAWMLGDREEDMQAGQQAGALPIGVGTSRERLEAAGAAVVLKDVNELEAILPLARPSSDASSA